MKHCENFHVFQDPTSHVCSQFLVIVLSQILVKKQHLRSNDKVLLPCANKFIQRLGSVRYLAWKLTENHHSTCRTISWGSRWTHGSVIDIFIFELSETLKWTSLKKGAVRLRLLTSSRSLVWVDVSDYCVYILCFSYEDSLGANAELSFFQCHGCTHSLCLFSACDTCDRSVCRGLWRVCRLLICFSLPASDMRSHGLIIWAILSWQHKRVECCRGNLITKRIMRRGKCEKVNKEDPENYLYSFCLILVHVNLAMDTREKKKPIKVYVAKNCRGRNE